MFRICHYCFLSDVKEGETQSVNKVFFSANNEHKQNETDNAAGVKQSEGEIVIH